MKASPREEFARLARSPDDAIDVARAALLIAAEENPSLDVDRVCAEIEAMSAEVARRIVPGMTTVGMVRTLIDYLHREVGLVGDRSTYYDPANSFLNDVLARKRGIPISLATIYIAVGRGAGIPLVGVGFPSHFLIGVYLQVDTLAPTSLPDVFIDPFRPDELMGIDECRRFFTRLGGAEGSFDERMLMPVTSRQMLVRMLTNLKMIYAQTGRADRAIAAVDRILLLMPQATHELRDRGALNMALDLYSLAIDDFERYLQGEPDADDRDTIELAISSLRERVDMLH
jgi:regulator of sirC expression with transglutaminase-like and TPR domain